MQMRRRAIGLPHQGVRQLRAGFGGDNADRMGVAQVADRFTFQAQQVARDWLVDLFQQAIAAAQIGQWALIFAPDHRLLAGFTAPDHHSDHSCLLPVNRCCLSHRSYLDY